MSGWPSMRNPNHYLPLLLLKHLLLIGITVSIILFPKFLVTSCHLSAFTYLPLVLGTFLATLVTVIKAISFLFLHHRSLAPLLFNFFILMYGALLWNPSMVINIIFIDHFTKYIWFYPMKKKVWCFRYFYSFQSACGKFFEQTNDSTIHRQWWGISCSQFLFFIFGSSWCLPPHHSPILLNVMDT